jgi:23S rRNA-/tRNA-specific pseudouridylate synthase
MLTLRHDAGTKRCAELDSTANGDQRPTMPIIYKDDNFLVVHKPWDVRMVTTRMKNVHVHA